MVTTDGNGDASFTFSSAQVADGESITATATKQTTGDTSEFSAAIEAGQAQTTACDTATNVITGNNTLSGTAGDDKILGRGERIRSPVVEERIASPVEPVPTTSTATEVLGAVSAEDLINPGNGEVLVRANAGNDEINSDDGVAETINCGRGARDWATGDASDTFIDCETVLCSR